jgi:hypothetical protein
MVHSAVLRDTSRCVVWQLRTNKLPPSKPKHLSEMCLRNLSNSHVTEWNSMSQSWRQNTNSNRWDSLKFYRKISENENRRPVTKVVGSYFTDWTMQSQRARVCVCVCVCVWVLKTFSARITAPFPWTVYPACSSPTVISTRYARRERLSVHMNYLYLVQSPKVHNN